MRSIEIFWLITAGAVQQAVFIHAASHILAVGCRAIGNNLQIGSTRKCLDVRQ